MTNIVITSIGLGIQQSGRYVYSRYRFPDGKKLRSKYFPGALLRDIKPDCLIVLLTQKAREITWEKNDMRGYMKRLCGTKTKLVPLTIPDGSNEGELWQIFSLLAGAIPHEDELIIPAKAHILLDITHALRSLPIVVLNTISYLARTREVTLDAIYYAAFETKANESAPAPVYALQATLLLEWASAVVEFLHSGDSTRLAQLLEDRQNEFYRDSTAATARPKNLKSVAKALRRLSLTLDLARPVESADAAAHLLNELEQVQPDLRHAPQFTVLYDQVRAEFADFALEAKVARADSQALMRSHLAFIAWCQRRNRLLSAAINAQEWLISWLILRDGMTDLFSREAREAKSRDLGIATVGASPRSPDPTEELERRVRDIWWNFSEVRNDIAHVGLREQPKSAEILRQSIDQLVQALREVAAQS